MDLTHPKHHIHLILLRILSACIIMLCAYGLVSWSYSHVKRTHLVQLRSLSQDTFPLFDDWFIEKQQFILPLINDVRIIQSIRSNSPDSPLTRRAIYEFSYMHKLNSLYLFPKNDTLPFIITAGAPELPLPLQRHIAEAQTQEKESFAGVYIIGGQELFFMLHNVIDPETNTIIGYLGYLEPVKTAFTSLQENLNRLTQEFQISLYFKHDDQQVMAIENITNSLPFLRPLMPSSTNRPVFHLTHTRLGVFSDFLHREILAAITPISNHTNWSISTSELTGVAFQDQSLLRQIIWVVGTILAMAALLVSIRGHSMKDHIVHTKTIIIKEKPKKVEVKLKDIPSMEEAERRRILAMRRKIDDPDNPFIEDTDLFPIKKTNKPQKENEHDDIIRDLNQGDDDDAREIGDEAESTTELPEAEEVSTPNLTTNATNTENDTDEAILTSAEQLSKKRIEKIGPSGNEVVYAIKSSIRNKRIKILYQPIVNRETNAIDMYEILLRLDDDNGQELPPSVIFPVAKENGLNAEIDACVVNTVVDRHLARKGQNVTVTINLTSEAFDSIAFIESLVRNISERGMPTNLLIFELRSIEIIESDKGMAFIRSLREMGCRFSVDYFGGGPMFVDAAKKMNLDFIKINALNFDPEKADDEKLRELILVTQTANGMGIPVVMEKIETEAVRTMCDTLKVPYLQGFHIGKPQNGLF